MVAQLSYVKWVLKGSRTLVHLELIVGWGQARLLGAHQITWWKNVTIPLIQLCTALPAAAGLDTIQTTITIATIMPIAFCNKVTRLPKPCRYWSEQGVAFACSGRRPETQAGPSLMFPVIVTTAEQINLFPTRILPIPG